MSDLDDEFDAPRPRSPLVTVILGLGVVAAVAFYFLREPSFEATGDRFIDAACASGNAAMAQHLCRAPLASRVEGGEEVPIWFRRITTVPEYAGNAGYADAANGAISLSSDLEAAGQVADAAKARLYGALLAMGVGELGGARGQLEDARELGRRDREGDGGIVRHLAGLYLAQINWRLGEFEDGHDEIRAFVSRATDMENYLKAAAARAFADFIKSEERSDVYEWVIEDYQLIRELYQANEDWRRLGIAWYLQGRAEAAMGDYRRASLTFTTTAEVFSRAGFKELQAEAMLRHAEVMQNEVPSIAASLEREAAKIFTGIGIDPRAAMTDPLTLVLYDPYEEDTE